MTGEAIRPCTNKAPRSLLLITFLLILSLFLLLPMLIPTTSLFMCHTDLRKQTDTPKHGTLTRCWFDFGPESTMLALHSAYIGSTYRFCWEMVT